MTQYLILHKVRGKPSFDCAEPVCQGKPCQPNCGNWDGTRCKAEDEWITNSGYRAYPYWKWPLHELVNDELTVPADWPDHFEVRKEPKMEINLGDILSGLIGKFPRRA